MKNVDGPSLPPSRLPCRLYRRVRFGRERLIARFSDTRLSINAFFVQLSRISPVRVQSLSGLAFCNNIASIVPNRNAPKYAENIAEKVRIFLAFVSVPKANKAYSVLRRGIPYRFSANYSRNLLGKRKTKVGPRHVRDALKNVLLTRSALERSRMKLSFYSWG